MTKNLTISGDILINDTSLVNPVVSTIVLDVIENYTEIIIQDMTVAASATNVAISFGDVDVPVVLLIIIPTYVTAGTPANFLTCKINSSVTATPIGKLLVVSGYSTTGISTITITNSDTSNPVQIKLYACK